MIEIRPERREDIPTVRMINELAFGQSQEADIVETLREDCPDTLSLVAVLDGRVVGHIFFSPAVIVNGQKKIIEPKRFQREYGFPTAKR